MTHATPMDTAPVPWWLVALRGVLGIIWGIAALAWPGLALAVLVVFFGAYMFVDGVIALVFAIRHHRDRARLTTLLLEACW